jgi:hypothetical protein
LREAIDMNLFSDESSSKVFRVPYVKPKITDNQINAGEPGLFTFLSKSLLTCRALIKIELQLDSELSELSTHRVVSHLPNIATLCRGTHFSKCTDVVWSYGARDPQL